jgi:hypothetical protein
MLLLLFKEKAPQGKRRKQPLPEKNSQRGMGILPIANKENPD